MHGSTQLHKHFKHRYAGTQICKLFKHRCMCGSFKNKEFPSLNFQTQSHDQEIHTHRYTDFSNIGYGNISKMGMQVFKTQIYRYFQTQSKHIIIHMVKTQVGNSTSQRFSLKIATVSLTTISFQSLKIFQIFRIVF